MLTLGRRQRLSHGFEPPLMRLTEDARRSVVFLGHTADPERESTFKAQATGFFVIYKGVKYLVTAAHVAIQMGDDPFDLRVNETDGRGGLVHVDPGSDKMDTWFLHPDPSVDVAVIAFPYGFKEAGWDQKAMGGDLLLSDEDIRRHDVGPGDTCYAVGLFRLLQGYQRNLAVVHRGSIAAMAGDELIPVRNWRGDGRIDARAYLVEAANLKGLSGSPVFVRPTINVIADRFTIEGAGEGRNVIKGGIAGLGAPSADVYLLGIWSASWDAQLDEVSALDHGSEARVPLGFGVVVPTSCLIELLDTEAVEAQRRELWEAYGPKPAEPDTTPA